MASEKIITRIGNMVIETEVSIPEAERAAKEQGRRSAQFSVIPPNLRKAGPLGRNAQSKRGSSVERSGSSKGSSGDAKADSGKASKRVPLKVVEGGSGESGTSGGSCEAPTRET